MSAAQVTEEHIYTTAKVGKAYVAGEDAQAAQIIADSEAKAVLNAAESNWSESIGFIITERDQLRAEVERLKPYVSKAVLTHEGTMLCSPLVAVKFNEQTARAERAEAKVSNQAERIRYLEGATNHATGTPLSIAIARAERAEAKLNESRYETVKAAQEGLRECIRAERAEAELAGIRALASRRNKSDHSQDTTHQLVAALDQALDIAQAELAATKSTLDEEVNCAEKAEHEVVRQYARAERAEADADSTGERALALANSLDEAQAELAAERARLDWLMAGGVCLVQHSGGFYVSRLHAQVSRAAIDSGMKEVAK